MDEPTLEELMQDILEIVVYPNREAGEFTAKELFEKSGMDTTYESFRGILDSKVDRGLLEKRMAMVDGKKFMVYKKKR